MRLNSLPMEAIPVILQQLGQASLRCDCHLSTTFPWASARFFEAFDIPYIQRSKSMGVATMTRLFRRGVTTTTTMLWTKGSTGSRGMATTHAKTSIIVRFLDEHGQVRCCALSPCSDPASSVSSVGKFRVSLHLGVLSGQCMPMRNALP